MRIFSETINRSSISVLKDIPSRIEYISGGPSKAYFAGGQSCSIGCLGCTNPRCMKFEASEITCSEVESFPNDQSLNVCPVDALSWDNEQDIPKVDSTKCINCGICLRRCPVGAIYYNNGVYVNATTSQQQTTVAVDSSTMRLQTKQIEALEDIDRSGVLIMESDKLMESIYEKLNRLRPQFHNTVGRNLLISLGCNSAMRRIGDVYTRMDAVYSSPDGCFGAVEVEFGRDTLDASRGILDDIAVLYTRYGIDKDANLPLVICLQLPNARQGYWQVVKDIKNVEDIAIATITIGAMLLLNWNGCFLIPDDVTYHLDYDNMDLRSVISWQLDRQINISDKLLGILEPQK